MFSRTCLRGVSASARGTQILRQGIRRASTATGEASASSSPARLTAAGTAATTVAIGSMAWYWHLYGSEVHAMTPAEEG